MRICVFCGSTPGARPSYATAAESLARYLVTHRHTVIYGGGNTGLMAVVADTALALGGEVIGVMPEALIARERAHTSLTKMHITGSMHERKALMAELADAFIALPGGFGTFEEFCEILTWAQLGMHRKPCGILNVQGYYDRLLAMFDHAVHEQFVKPAHRKLLIADSDPAALVERLIGYEMPRVDKFIAEGQE
jgi:uncharacterized protein (TIGR00730 family)